MNMAKQIDSQKDLMEFLNPVRFQLSDGRPLEMWGVHRDPDDGVLVIELVNTAEMEPEVAQMRAGSSNIRRFWTRAQVEGLLRWLFTKAATPELVKEYMDSHDLRHFGGMTQLQIDSEFGRFLQSKREKRENEPATDDPGDSRISGSRSDPNNKFNFDA
jgi:hypothetical protein